MENMHLKSMFDEEKESKHKRELYEEKVLTYGRTDRLPQREIFLQIKTKGRIDPIFLLENSGYKKIGLNYGWAKYFSENARNYRFHAYISPTKVIKIHSDLIKGKKKHKASLDFCKEEKERIKNNIVRLIQPKVKAKKQLSDREYREAMAKLKEKKPLNWFQRLKLLWK